jgi:hypothetical protein
MKWHGVGKLWFNGGKGSNKKLLWSFDGEFAEGKKHGVGTKTHWVEGWKYEGQWQRDAMIGCGTLTCPRLEGALRADVYQGSFVDGVPHGNCKYMRGDGQMQDGEFMHGEFVRGDACLKFANDAVYTGMCAGNLMHGLGTTDMKGPVAAAILAARMVPDGIPVIDTAADGRVVLAFGHGHLGLTQGPATALAVRALIEGSQPPFPLAPYRARRFFHSEI